MLGIGMPHLLLLAAIALIAIGPKQLPEVARVIGRFLNDLKKVRDEFTRTIVESRDNVNQNLYHDAPSHPTTLESHTDTSSSASSAFVDPAVEPAVETALDEHNQMAFDMAPEVQPTTDIQKKDS